MNQVPAHVLALGLLGAVTGGLVGALLEGKRKKAMVFGVATVLFGIALPVVVVQVGTELGRVARESRILANPQNQQEALEKIEIMRRRGLIP